MVKCKKLKYEADFRSNKKYKLNIYKQIHRSVSEIDNENNNIFLSKNWQV